MWNAKRFSAIVQHPIWNPNPNTDDKEIHIKVRLPPDNEDITPIAKFRTDNKVKRFNIRAKDAESRGLWPTRCYGCRMIRDGMTPQGHSEECRVSIEDMLARKGDKERSRPAA